MCCNSNIQQKNESMTEKNSIFIVPLIEKSLICKIENNEIQELGILVKGMESKSIVVNDEFICSIDTLISVYDIKGNLLKEIKSDFELTSLNSKNRVVYFGGKSSYNKTNSGEIFAILDLEYKDFRLVKINIPIDVSYGKAIDDILIIKNKLLLVDNIIYPKYLLEYDITDPNTPKHIETKELENNGTYEHIVKGDLNENWLVLLSSAVGRGGLSDHIVIEGKTKGHISVHPVAEFEQYIKTKEQNLESFEDICLVDNMLYVLVDSIYDSIVYSLNLNNNILKKEMKKINSKLNSIRKIIRGPNNEIIFVDYENNYEKYN